jgi:hypothetical protein
MSSHISNAFASEISAFFRSPGRSWTTPPEIDFEFRASLIGLSSGIRVSGRQTRTPLGLKADDSFMVAEGGF